MSSFTKLRPFLPVFAVMVILVGVGVIVKVNQERSRPAPPEEVPKSTRTGGKPNVLVIMTDDQTLEAMRVLDNVNSYIAKAGTTFTNYSVSFPNCCPSRATYMTGQYAHNDNVRDNVPPNGGWGNFRKNESLPVWLQRAGYWTASVGKFLNGWGADGDITPPPGWSHWYGLIDPTTYRYYDYSVSNDGTRLDYGDKPEDYQTDVLGTEVVRIIRDRATSNEPWYLSWTPLAPHAQEPEQSNGQNPSELSPAERIQRTFPVPAPRHKNKLQADPLPHPPSFNQKDMSKMPTFFQKRLPLGPAQQGTVRKGYQAENEALLAIDEWVGKIFTMLMRTEQARNTVVIFTSDNGYYHGEHRLTFSKVYLYEPGVHLPLVIRGGPFAKGATIDAMVGNVDLTPTILALAGATSPLTLDGRSLVTVARDPKVIDGRGMLLENWTAYGKEYTYGIRTKRYKYLTDRLGEEELYDLENDPDEVNNLAGDPALAGVRTELARRATALHTCAGATCEGADGKGG